jgi:DNA-binding response OmpR family regulator
MSAMRVLVVDDEPMMLEIAAGMLNASGFKVLTAMRGEDALEIARRERPAVVLCDIMMPGLDGRDVCRAMKEDPDLDGIPVVLHSSLREDEVDWQSSGADAYRYKLSNLRELPAFLRDLVKQAD